MENVRSISAGSKASAAVMNDGSLWIWGYRNDDLGDKTTNLSCRTKPEKVMEGVVSVTLARGNRTYVVKNDGTVWAFGCNTSGQIGDGTEAELFQGNAAAGRAKPVKVMDNVKAIAAGGSHSLAVTNDNVLWCWGSNRQSQRQGTGAHVFTPARTMEGVASVASFGAYTLAMKQDGSLWFWRDQGRSAGLEILMSTQGIRSFCGSHKIEKHNIVPLESSLHSPPFSRANFTPLKT